MAASNAKVADLLRRYAAALTLQGADRFKVKAYRRAAETVDGLDRDIGQLVASGEDLTSLPGVGKGISAVIREVLSTGKLTPLENSLATLKPELVELATRPGLDPAKVQRIYKKLGIASLTELKSKLESGEIGRLLGSRLEFHVRRGLDDRPRRLLWQVRELAEAIEQFLGSIDWVERVSPVGSLRRKQETVGDLNFLVATNRESAVFKLFAEFGGVQLVEVTGEHQRRFMLSSGLNISLTCTKGSAWGWSLIEQTGSPLHVEQLRHRKKKSVKRSGILEEAEVYRAAGLAFIEPELREGRGEIEAAEKGNLPRLIEYKDLRGDLHMHTTSSDGANSIQEMCQAAETRGYEYIAITDHSQSLKITNGLSEKRLREQLKVIDRLNRSLKKLRILKSAEVDILEDGRLDYSNAILRELDFTICSIHSRFALNKQQQTERILRAMDNPYFNILGHATGRLLLQREGYELDVERVLRHAQERGCMFEINSSPNRLDLSDENARRAKELGIQIAINTDAHSISEMAFISAGINQARRAWLEVTDVMNTRSLGTLLKLFKR